MPREPLTVERVARMDAMILAELDEGWRTFQEIAPARLSGRTTKAHLRSLVARGRVLTRHGSDGWEYSLAAVSGEDKER